MLGVSVERVRQLVVSDHLSGVRFGSAWAVPRSEVKARQNQANGRGRPLRPRGSWEAIFAGNVQLDSPIRYRNRAQMRRYQVGPGDAAFLRAHDSVLTSGVDAANGYGESLAANDLTVLYLEAKSLELLDSVVALVPSPQGQTIFCVVEEGIWSSVVDHSSQFGQRRLVSHAAVALDLMNSADPRHWEAAERLLEGARAHD